MLQLLVGRDDRGRLEGHKGSGALSTSCPVGTWAMGGVGWASADYQKDGGPCITGLLGGPPASRSFIDPAPPSGMWWKKHGSGHQWLQRPILPLPLPGCVILVNPLSTFL